MNLLLRFKHLLALAAVAAAGAALSPTDRAGGNIFLSAGNQGDVLRQVATNGVLTVGMTLVILSGGIDLAVGVTTALGSVIAAKALMAGLGIPAAVACALLAGLATGLASGALVAFGRVQPFIATLAMTVAVLGVARLAAGEGGMVCQILFGEGLAPPEFRGLAARWFGVVPVPGAIFLAVAAAAWFVVEKLPLGRRLLAVGGNEEAAHCAGVAVARVKLFAYGASGLLAGITGVLYAAQYTQGKPDAGTGFELDAVAAAVIGGANLRGGEGTIPGAVAGVLLFGYLNNILQLQNVDSNRQLVLKGAIIACAALLQRPEIAERVRGFARRRAANG